MIAKLEFNMDDEDGRSDFEIYNRSHDMYASLHTIDELCRKVIKYAEKKVPKETEELVREIREEIGELDLF